MTKKRTRKVEAKALKLKKTDGKKPASRCSVKAPAATAAPETQPAAKPVDVKISAAKGRPMLSWVGKRPLFHVRAFPAQLVERHGALQILGMSAKDAMNSKERVRVFRDLRGQWNGECWEKSPLSGAAAPEDGGLLFHGDNKEVLAYLLANGYRGKVNLVYIDPPFDSGADYVRKVNLRGPKGTIKLDGDSYCLGEQIQYGDIWNNDGYLQFMYERFLLLKELLAEGGFLMAHFDSNRVHYMRVLLDEVFGDRKSVV